MQKKIIKKLWKEEKTICIWLIGATKLFNFFIHRHHSGSMEGNTKMMKQYEILNENWLVNHLKKVDDIDANVQTQQRLIDKVKIKFLIAKISHVN